MPTSAMTDQPERPQWAGFGRMWRRGSSGAGPARASGAGRRLRTGDGAGPRPRTVNDSGSRPGTANDSGSRPRTVNDAGSRPGTVNDAGPRPGAAKDSVPRPGAANGAGPRLGTGESTAPSPGPDPHESLLTSKITVPALPGWTVRRERIERLIEEGARGPLTVVTGPPGAGKTMALARWAATTARPGPIAWVTLDRFDNRPEILWSYIV